MCGIAGIVTRPGNAVSRTDLQRMTAIVDHRGPDGEGLSISANVGLGHRRLAILDLTAAGQQPMHSANGDLAIVFNGEIYNYLELREELISLGHRFHSRTDTEVILEAYLAWGEGCVSRFNGMWSFAIHDKRRNLLFCSRDRFGVKPFYYYASDGLFVFGSEIKQLLDFLPRRMANRAELFTFLVIGLADCSPKTFFHDIHKLASGHNLVLNVQTGEFKVEPYYRLLPVDLSTASEEEVEDRFAVLFKDAIHIRLRSDVPVGSCLSGGLDSSAIATFASTDYREAAGKPFCAITGVSSDPALDESRYAEAIVNASGLEWARTKPSFSDFENSLSRLVYQQDEPFPTLSIMMQYQVMRTSRERQVPVLLDGQGADEALLGYISYFGFNVIHAWKRNGPLAAFDALRNAGRQNPELSPLRTARYMMGFTNTKLKYSWLKHKVGFLAGMPCLPEAVKQWSESTGDLVEFQKNEIFSYTLPALLRYEDRNSMAWGIETRLPFLDYRLLEFMIGLPLSFKLRNGWTKYILRKTIDRDVPDMITWRRSKIGFAAPDQQWIGSLRTRLEMNILESDLIRRISPAADTLQRRLSRLDHRRLWRLASVALWAQRFGVTDVT